MYNKTLSEILMNISTEAYLYVLTNPTQSFKYSTLNEVSMLMLSNINYKTTIIILGSARIDYHHHTIFINLCKYTHINFKYTHKSFCKSQSHNTRLLKKSSKNIICFDL